ncbi:MAG: hypothetical protein GXO63_01940 [Candidatus Micrarchaeota archaeon]|nr:hypothetical protein [Candidatus Micrarchaeota archaeon]
MKRFLPILIVVLVSGCVQSESKIVASGITVTDFSSSIDEVEGMGRTVRISMEIENTGGYSTSNVLACLMGSSFPGRAEDQMWETESDICQPVDKELYAADPETRSPGGFARFSWKLKSPWLPYPQVRTDEFTGRVFYRYKSQTSAKIWVYSDDEIRAAKQRGESLSKPLEIVKSVGPVDIDLSVKQPVSAENGYFTVTITVSNVGGGVVFDDSNFDYGSSDIPKIGELNVVHLTYTYPAGELEADACDDVVELRMGETRRFSCGFTIKNPEKIRTKTSFPITVSATYGYYMDTTLSVTVKGKKGESP